MKIHFFTSYSFSVFYLLSYRISSPLQQFTVYWPMCIHLVFTSTAKDRDHPAYYGKPCGTACMCRYSWQTKANSPHLPSKLTLSGDYRCVRSNLFPACLEELYLLGGSKILLRLPPRLRKLFLNHPISNCTDTGYIEQFWTHLSPSLTHLTLNYSGDYSLDALPPSLTHLTIRTFDGIPQNLPRLQYDHLPKSLTHLIVDYLPNSCPFDMLPDTLQYLRIRQRNLFQQGPFFRYGVIFPINLDYLPHGLQTLEALCLISNVTTFDNFTSLTTVVLHTPCQEILDNLPRCLQFLTIYNLYYTRSVDHLPQLTHLCLFYKHCPYDDDDDDDFNIVPPYVDHLPTSITHLKLKNCSSDSAVVVALDHLPLMVRVLTASGFAFDALDYLPPTLEKLTIQGTITSLYHLPHHLTTLAISTTGFDVNSIMHFLLSLHTFGVFNMDNFLFPPQIKRVKLITRMNKPPPHDFICGIPQTINIIKYTIGGICSCELACVLSDTKVYISKPFHYVMQRKHGVFVNEKCYACSDRTKICHGCFICESKLLEVSTPGVPPLLPLL